ncbi:GNAT family N-acetyltransferase [Prochlorococcus marinus]|jgi:CelD/BcsL family acetyltransferase involved in cellulose biosynthesis|uniref:BioF2-like acetyltransferase domain-containing protein n=1 Tax=Prochlorococcus marinus (strain MIT 9301) TaxID=167546 RepID=A3PE67_PROM0|nr:GNAT family N-acetyltransferase [Prochlorococcus marinus]ABO18042.1 Hypothetical protein P9301_14191 [Prochlorococcus marinus str. MIT 9301]
MIFTHKIFDSFNSELISCWLNLEQNSICNAFNSLFFHNSIYHINKKFKKNYWPLIICLYEKNNIAAILPLEKFNSSNTLVVHGSEFIDYDGIIFSRQINHKEFEKYILKNILSKYDIFFHSIGSNNKLINSLSNKLMYKLKWRYSIRYFIDAKKYDDFFLKKKKFIKKTTKNITKNNLSSIEIKLPNEKLSHLENHIILKSLQYNSTNNRNPFKNKRYKKLLEYLIKNYSKNIVIYILAINKSLQSILIAFKSKDKFCYYQPSYSRESTLESPGKILMYYAIKIANKNSIEFDFSTGNENYKMLYSTDNEIIHSYFLSNKLFPNFLNLIIFWILYYEKSRKILRSLFNQAKKFMNF